MIRWPRSSSEALRQDRPSIDPGSAFECDARSAVDPPRCTDIRPHSWWRPGVERRPSRQARRSRRAFPGANRRSVRVHRPRTFHRCLAKCPACQCRSSYRRSSARTWSAPAPRGGGTRPRSPSGVRGVNWRSARAGLRYESSVRRPPDRIEQAAFHRWPALVAQPRCDRNQASFEPPCRCHRTRSRLQGVRRPPDRGCSSTGGGRLPAASPCTRGLCRAGSERCGLLQQARQPESSCGSQECV